VLLYSKVAEGYTKSAWSYESKLEACRSFLLICCLSLGIRTAGSFIAGVCSSRLPLLVPGKLISYNYSYIHLWTVYPTELRNQRMNTTFISCWCFCGLFVMSNFCTAMDCVLYPYLTRCYTVQVGSMCVWFCLVLGIDSDCFPYHYRPYFNTRRNVNSPVILYTM